MQVNRPCKFEVATPSASRWDETPGRPKGGETPGGGTRWDETPGRAKGSETPGGSTTPHRGSETPGATPSARMWEATPSHATPGSTTPGNITPGHSTPGMFSTFYLLDYHRIMPSYKAIFDSLSWQGMPKFQTN